MPGLSGKPSERAYGESAEAAAHAEFYSVRYAQCWEDADVLMEGLAVRPGDRCVSIASAGDNTMALLLGGPSRVVALDLNPAQLACLEMRMAAFRNLNHAGLLELIGSRPCSHRMDLYRACRGDLSPYARRFWDGRRKALRLGIGGAGKFERYFQTFRNRVLPLVHSRERVRALLRGGTLAERREFYDREWDSWRWRLMFRLFFSRFVLGRYGRDPSFFRYVVGPVAERILSRARYALTELDTADNPYLHWILTGTHGNALPLALRAEHFDAIRSHVDRLELRCQSLEDYLAGGDALALDRANLSDIFEYMSEANFERILERLLEVARPGARWMYWNTLVPRRRPDRLAERLRHLGDLSATLHGKDKAFFYCALHVEETV
jgi:S-adenosylmethionine-diacylglycerol 3-amino-3-carboxypropyl transferase